jgi:hypothetical protein
LQYRQALLFFGMQFFAKQEMVELGRPRVLLLTYLKYFQDVAHEFPPLTLNLGFLLARTFSAPRAKIMKNYELIADAYFREGAVYRPGITLISNI